jgi:hypothetical protein
MIILDCIQTKNTDTTTTFSYKTAFATSFHFERKDADEVHPLLQSHNMEMEPQLLLM